MSIVILTTPEQIEAILENVIKRNLASLNQGKIPAESEDLVDIKGACKLFQRSRQTITTYRKKGLIKAYSLEGRIFFKKSELIKALKGLDDSDSLTQIQKFNHK